MRDPKIHLGSRFRKNLEGFRKQDAAFLECVQRATEDVKRNIWSKLAKDDTPGPS